MLDTERPDAVWVCVTPDAHGALELGLIERGIHLMVEKPLAADAETPERISAALDAAGLDRGVAYHWRAMDTLRRGRRGDREPTGQAAQRPLARQPAGRRLVARPRDGRRPDGRAGDPPRGPLAPAAGGGDRGRGDRRPPPPPGVPRDGRARTSPRRSSATTPGPSGRSRRPASSAGRAPRRSACSRTTSRSRSASRASCTRTRGSRP